MALVLDDPTTERLAHELAAATGESVEDALRLALEERLGRVRERGTDPTGQDVLNEIVRRGRTRANGDDRTADEVLGYGRDGLPT